MFHYPAPFSDTKQEYRCAAYLLQEQRFFRFPICTSGGNRKAAADHRPFLQRSKYDIFCFFHFPSRCNIFSFPFPLFLCCRAFTGPFPACFQRCPLLLQKFINNLDIAFFVSRIAAQASKASARAAINSNVVEVGVFFCVNSEYRVNYVRVAFMDLCGPVNILT